VETGSRIRRSAFAIVALTLGGSVVLLASQTHASAVRSAAGARGSVPASKCEEFWGGDRDQTGKGKGPHLILYRNRRAVPGTSMDLLKGEMIGALENTSTIKDDPVYRTKLGRKNLANKVRGKGCISFKLTSPPTTNASAWFHPRASDDSIPLDYALYCPNHPGKVPDYKPTPVGCTKVIVSHRGISATVLLRPVAQAVTTADKQALEEQLMQFEPNERVVIVRMLTTASGAWFPCDASGCCRAS